MEPGTLAGIASVETRATWVRWIFFVGLGGSPFRPTGERRTTCGGAPASTLGRGFAFAVRGFFDLNGSANVSAMMLAGECSK